MHGDTNRWCLAAKERMLTPFGIRPLRGGRRGALLSGTSATTLAHWSVTCANGRCSQRWTQRFCGCRCLSASAWTRRRGNATCCGSTNLPSWFGIPPPKNAENRRHAALQIRAIAQAVAVCCSADAQRLRHFSFSSRFWITTRASVAAVVYPCGTKRALVARLKWQPFHRWGGASAEKAPTW